jgi:exopolyphosphatase/guanosine-5'-triphosphate,3'-diphosphate pyrophosphatase
VSRTADRSGPVAAVDVGSNSVRLLVLAADGARLRRDIVTTRLAAGVDATGRLDDAAIARTVTALAGFRATWEALGVATGPDRVRVAATSAVRDAADRDRFLVPAARALGVAVEVIDGATEAALAFAGATRAVAGAPAPVAVVDVGGGSTELVLGPPDGVGPPVAAVSMQLGCVRLTERALAGDPPTPAEVATARRVVDGVLEAGLADLVRAGGDPAAVTTLVGVAGTATTLAALHLGLATYAEERIHGAVVPAPALRDLADRLCGLATADRAALGPVQPGRAEVLHGGALVLAAVVARLGVPHLVVSEADSLDALARSRLQP